MCLRRLAQHNEQKTRDLLWFDKVESKLLACRTLVGKNRSLTREVDNQWMSNSDLISDLVKNSFNTNVHNPIEKGVFHERTTSSDVPCEIALAIAGII